MLRGFTPWNSKGVFSLQSASTKTAAGLRRVAPVNRGEPAEWRGSGAKHQKNKRDGLCTEIKRPGGAWTGRAMAQRGACLGARKQFYKYLKGVNTREGRSLVCFLGGDIM